MKQRWLVTEGKILRRIFWPANKRDGAWRTKRNDELNNFINNKNIIKCIKAQRLSWFGQVYRMTNNYVNGNRYLQG